MGLERAIMRNGARVALVRSRLSALRAPIPCPAAAQDILGSLSLSGSLARHQLASFLVKPERIRLCWLRRRAHVGCLARV
jgi:hypothetical protein